MRLFVYGTLLVPDIQRRVLGRELAGQTASASGYECRQLADTPYPIAVAAPEAILKGMLVDVHAKEWPILDDYEGSCYQRRVISAQVGSETEEAWCYLASPKGQASTRPL